MTTTLNTDGSERANNTDSSGVPIGALRNIPGSFVRPESSQLSEGNDMISADSVPAAYTGEDQINQNKIRRKRSRRQSISSFFSKELSDEEELAEDHALTGYQGDDIMGTVQLTRSLGGGTEQDVESLLESETSEGERPETIAEEEEEEEEEGDSQSRKEARENMPPLGKRRSSVAAMVSKAQFWDKEFKRERIKQFGRLALLMLGMTVLFMIVISVYTGSYYHRNQRFRKLKFYVINEDEAIQGIPLLIGLTVEELTKNPKIRDLGDWKVLNIEDFRREAVSNNNTVEEEVRRKIYHEKCWGAVYIPPRTTYRYYSAILAGNTSFNTSLPALYLYYETARDLLAVTNYIRLLLTEFELGYLAALQKGYFAPLTQQVFSLSQLSQITSSPASLAILTSAPMMTYIDTKPLATAMIIPAVQLGMVYILLFAFFGFISTVKVHVFVAKKVKGRRFILYRMLASQSVYVVLALAYCSLNAMFKVPYNATFGHSGFLVLWGVTFLALNAVGSINECAALFCFSFFPPSVGPWVLTWTVFNITPTFSIIPLCPPFYRYGFAMPIHNLYEVLKIIFCGGYKGNMARQIGILIAWAILGNTALPFVQTHVGKKMKRKAAAAEKEKKSDTKKGGSSSSTPPENQNPVLASTAKAAADQPKNSNNQVGDEELESKKVAHLEDTNPVVNNEKKN